jgi:hypothetical protein
MASAAGTAITEMIGPSSETTAVESLGAFAAVDHGLGSGLGLHPAIASPPWTDHVSGLAGEALRGPYGGRRRCPARLGSTSGKKTPIRC